MTRYFIADPPYRMPSEAIHDEANAETSPTTSTPAVIVYGTCCVVGCNTDGNYPDELRYDDYHNFYCPNCYGDSHPQEEAEA